jgi:hypothetical protein
MTNMKDIPIGKKGLILSGQYKGWYIQVEPEGKNGYLILYIKDPTNPKSEGYDHWVLKAELGKYFDEVKLDIKWPTD